MKNVKDFYDKTAGDWADKWYQDESMLPYLNYFIEKLPEDPVVLDLCCGSGYESMRLHRLGAEVVGIDFSGASIAVARQRNPNILFYADDMLHDYSYAGSFDGVLMIAGLVHLPNDYLRRAFENVYKVLKEGGLLFLSIKEGTGKSDKQSFTSIDGEEYDRDFYLHTLDELKQYSDGMFDYVEELSAAGQAWKKYLFLRRE